MNVEDDDMEAHLLAACVEAFEAHTHKLKRGSNYYISREPDDTDYSRNASMARRVLDYLAARYAPPAPVPFREHAPVND